MNIKGLNKSLSAKEEQDRRNFILRLIRIGLSRTEIIKQFGEQFNVKFRTARAAYEKVLTYLHVPDTMEERRLIKSSMVEMYHTQVTSAQNDILSLQEEIERIDNYRKKKQDLENLTIQGDKSAEFKLELLPNIPESAKANLLGLKSKMRSDMFEIMKEIGRIQGCYSADMPWLLAVNTLIDNDLLTPETAEEILNKMEGLRTTKTVEAISVEVE